MESDTRQMIRSRLTANRERVLSAVAGVTPAQACFRANADTWSILDCLEHVTLVESRVMHSMERVLREPAVEAPGPVRPSRKCPDLTAHVEAFLAARERSLLFASETDADLRAHVFPHIYFGDLDCCQWPLFLGTHAERHVRQIEEVKAHPEYPRTVVAD